MPRPVTEFPEEIKSKIFEAANMAIREFSSEDKKEEVFKNQYHFIDEDRRLVNKIIRFANRGAVKPIALKNVNFCFPSSFMQTSDIAVHAFSFGGAGAELVEIFDDFIRQAVRLADGRRNTRLLNRKWRRLEKDFFAEEVTIVFRTQIANFYYQGGGVIEDLIPDRNITVRYLRPGENTEDKSIYYSFKESIDSSYKPTCDGEFNQSIVPIIIEVSISAKKGEKKMEDYFKEARDSFEKTVFLLRLICGGSAHIGFVRPFFFGNYASNTHLTQNLPENHLFSNNRNSTTLDNGPYETWVQRAWEGLKNRDIAEWQFANQKLRDSYTRIIQNDYYHLDSEYKLARQLERLVDLVQAAENTVGDYGRHIADYIAKLVARGDTGRESEIREKVEYLYFLRDKYLHGKPNGPDSVESMFNSKFQGKIEVLEQATNS